MTNGPGRVWRVAEPSQSLTAANGPKTDTMHCFTNTVFGLTTWLSLSILQPVVGEAACSVLRIVSRPRPKSTPHTGCPRHTISGWLWRVLPAGTHQCHQDSRDGPSSLCKEHCIRNHTTKTASCHSQFDQPARQCMKISRASRPCSSKSPGRGHTTIMAQLTNNDIPMFHVPRAISPWASRAIPLSQLLSRGRPTSKK